MTPEDQIRDICTKCTGSSRTILANTCIVKLCPSCKYVLEFELVAGACPDRIQVIRAYNKWYDDFVVHVAFLERCGRSDRSCWGWGGCPVQKRRLKTQ